MSLLSKFWQIISTPFRHLGGEERPIGEIYKELAKLNANKFYIENIRSLLDIPYPEAVEVVNEAVAEGYFKKGVEFVAPDGAVALSVDDANNLEEIPETVECWESAEGGDYEPVEYRTDQLNQRPYYRLNAIR